ncbi:hypothetical protein CYMTET_11233 [Cymbomonas tetramitiformis]|uniref:Uncharacterized protein n=1 Tax=Cymbomonas tetramitiformis TaxID=36881 RepID=A0AAE0LDN5_9CHLO|nr:hypothetical protein CYMTET_11233 [Cymbomonas tetramitiformis]
MHKVSDIGADQEKGQTKEIQRAELFGFQLDLTGPQLFALLTAGSLVSAISFSALQEGAYRVPGFRFSGWMTELTMLTYCFCGFLEMIACRTFQRKGSIKDYLVLSALTMGGMYFTNWSLAYLNYTTRIVFKSSKVVPTMIFGTVVQGRRYTVGEYLAAAVLIVGISLFTLGDAQGYPAFHSTGIGLITLGLVCDALTSNFEEKRFFRCVDPSSQAEVVMYASFFGAIYGAVVLVWSGEWQPALEHSIEQPMAPMLIITSAVMGYVSVVFVLSLINNFGATNTEIVKSMRKVLSICISFILFPKPFDWKYLLGMLACIISLVVTHMIKKQKMSHGGTSM